VWPQACSAAYYADCEALFGSVFAHDDSVNDRTPGSKLQTNWATSQAHILQPSYCCWLGG
jgi:hypothetical protein